MPSVPLDAICQPAFLYDPDGRIAAANDLAEGLAGRSLAGLALAAVIETFDIRSPDGTPLAAADLPAAGALRGEGAVGIPFVVTTADGRTLRVVDELQVDFALNQPLSAFAIAVIETLDPESPDYALDVVSVIEATLEDPMVILLQQQFTARGQAVQEMKADGLEYEERMDALEEITWPRPLADVLTATHQIYAAAHPWLSETPVKPKSVVRDMYARGMRFGEFVAHYKVQRSEGLLLRYLSDAYRALRQTVPEASRTEELADLIAWLGEVTRLVDSSLIDEWNRLPRCRTPTPSRWTPPRSRHARSPATPARAASWCATRCGGASS